MANIEKYRGRVHMILLYPDNEAHVEALDRISKSYDYAAILHDKDIWTAEDEAKNPEHKAGELKKPHYHVVVRTGNNATWNTALCKELGIDLKFCEQVKVLERALQYLIHYNDSDKAQYEVDAVFGSMKVKLAESINKVEKSEGEKVVELINFITSYNGRLRVTDFATYCAKEGYWSEFRRSGSIFCKMIEEHNERHSLWVKVCEDDTPPLLDANDRELLDYKHYALCEDSTFDEQVDAKHCIEGTIIEEHEA